MLIAKILRILCVAIMLVMSNGCVPTAGATIHFSSSRESVDGFGFYLSVEEIVGGSGFQRVMQKGKSGAAPLRYEDEKYFISNFKPVAAVSGDGVIDVSIYYRKEDGSTELTMVQYPAEEFSDGAKMLLKNLVSALRDRFGSDSVTVEEKH